MLSNSSKDFYSLSSSTVETARERTKASTSRRNTGPFSPSTSCIRPSSAELRLPYRRKPSMIIVVTKPFSIPGRSVYS